MYSEVKSRDKNQWIKLNPWVELSFDMMILEECYHTIDLDPPIL